MKNDLLLIELKKVLSPEKILIGEDLTQRYYHIWKMDQPLEAKAVLLPTSTEEVSAILKICHAHHQAVVVHGGLTNLVGATKSSSNEVVISMEKMNRIIEVDEKSRSISAQGGVILENILEAAAKKDLLFPLSFGAKGSAQIGGIISSNAGGLKVFRYGMTRHLVLGLEVVLADGTILSSMKKIIKDNSGYDLKQLFIGSEGTLGIVTAAVLQLQEAPKSRTSAFVAFDAYEEVVDFLKYMDAGLAGTLSSYELIWKSCYEGMTSPPAQAKPPIPHGYEYYVLLEGLGSHQTKDQERMEELLEEAFEKNKMQEAAMATTESDLNWFWKIREDVHAVVSQLNNDQHFDISLPIPSIGKTIDAIVKELESTSGVEKVICFGHVADGNIHIIVGKESEDEGLKEKINQIVYAPLKELGGSVSAEHGIGIDKKNYLSLCRTEAEITLMKTLKQAMDPRGILNPNRIFD